MRKLIGAAAWLMACMGAHAALPANVEQVETFRGVAQYRLKSNGMTIHLAPNHAAPVFTFMVVYHVGSRNEAPGNTGSAHLLEHMIFNKSTENFGRAHGHKTFQEVIYEGGGDAGSSNMTTWYDRMTGYTTLPAGKVELAMRIEADRLGRGLILEEERQSEMSVVRNEYEIGENNPARALGKAVTATAIQAHPYHWHTIGYRSDIEGVTTAKLREHYRTYFHPDNAEAILTGDFDTEAALTLFDSQFGGFPRAAHPIPQVITVEPPQQGERRTVVRRPGTLNMVQVAYMRPAASHPDFMALEALAVILGEGVNSRLYQQLVDKGLATGVSADNYALHDPYPLTVSATAAPGRSHAEVEAAIKAAITEVIDKGVTPQELARARQQVELGYLRSRDGSANTAFALGEAIASTDWKWFLTYLDRMNAVSVADVQRVAATYLTPDRTTVGWFVPTAAAAALASVPAAADAKAPAPAVTPNEPAAAMLAPSTARPFAARTVRKVLANGLVVDVVANRAVPTVSVRGIVLAGAMSTPVRQPALADMTGRMLARGTVSRTKEQIGALLDDVGATRTYTTQLAETSIEANARSRDLPLLLGVIADELQHPAFAPTELPKARRELENDYLRADDDTSQRAMQRLGQLAFAQGHPYYPAPRADKVNSAAVITEGELRAFHQERYVGAATILAIVGDVDPQATIALVEKLFGGMPTGSRPSYGQFQRMVPGNVPLRQAVTLRGKANMNIVMGEASGLRRADPDYEAALVANAALGQNALASRIGRRVRDTEGLTYSVFSRFLQSDEVDGLWLVNVNVAPQNLARAIKSTREVIDQYAKEGPTDAEVEVQKNFFAGNYRIGLGSNAGIASALATAERFGFGPRYLDEFPARVAAVTTEQAREALRKHFNAERLHLVVAGDLDKLPE